MEVQSYSALLSNKCFPTDGCTSLIIALFQHSGLFSSSAFAFAWRNYSPKSITHPRFYERFCMPLRLGANWGYWPSDSVFDEGRGVHHKLLMFLTWMGYFACHWHRHQVQGTSVLRLIRRTRAIEVKQLAQGHYVGAPILGQGITYVKGLAFLMSWRGNVDNIP
jgi:hypothetical protein